MRTFLISDTHFFHNNILTFKKSSGEPLRPFSSVEEMNETMVDNWNRVVSKNDKVYHLGDVAFRNASSLSILDRLNGDKVLVKGNHDIHKSSAYLKYFRDIRAYHVLDKILLAHVPVHPFSLSRWKGQVHGHLHDNYVPFNDDWGSEDPSYFNVSVERINYTPIDFEVIREYFKVYGQTDVIGY
jgi:calcineurin-like phosphoesterase family protein